MKKDLMAVWIVAFILVRLWLSIAPSSRNILYPHCHHEYREMPSQFEVYTCHQGPVHSYAPDLLENEQLLPAQSTMIYRVMAEIPGMNFRPRSPVEFRNIVDTINSAM
jgi:hypothetical protein